MNQRKMSQANIVNDCVNKYPTPLMKNIIPHESLNAFHENRTRDQHVKHVKFSHVNELPEDNNTELLILVDSNGKYLDRRKFWTLDRTTWLRCGNVDEARRLINRTRYTNIKYILIAVGVNDLDETDGSELADKFGSLIGSIHESYPDVKIILNEVTPRNDNRDEHVIKCNTKLQVYTTRHDHIFLSRQSNLRDDSYSFFHDNKHIKQSKIPRYASNMKIALRQAYGIPSWNNTRDQQKGIPSWNNTNFNTRDQQPKFNHSLPRYQNQIRETNQYDSRNQSGEHYGRTRESDEEKWKREFREKLLALLE